MAQGYVASKACLEVSFKHWSLKGKNRALVWVKPWFVPDNADNLPRCARLGTQTLYQYLEYLDCVGMTRRVGESRQFRPDNALPNVDAPSV